MTRTGQKDEELSYLDEFLRGQLSLDVIGLKPAAREPPDASVTVANSDKSKGLMDFELTEYYVDDPRDCQGGSPSKRTSGWWDKVQAALDLQLEILRLPVDVGVRFKEPIVLKNS